MTRSTTFPARRRTASCLLAALVVGIPMLTAACSDDSDASPSSTTASTAPAASEATAPGHEHVEVTAVDFSFEDLPSTIEAGTRLSLRNKASRELHELVAFRLPDDEKRSVGELLQLPEADLGPMLGAPTTVLLAAPGQDQIPAVGDGTLTEPGRYLVMCSIPTGVDPAAYLKAAAAANGQKPDLAGGPPHFTSGMFAELTVR
ncbi:MAG: hypothetical protein JST64_08825 [Actinobacteria bacterium]|nr:hypothetical protein [Actinomycetota bacterium]